MLGTNDLKPRFSAGPFDIAAGAGALLFAINTLVPPWTKAPRLLLISPPHAISTGWLADMFAGADARAKQLAPLYRTQAERHGAAFFDAAAVAKVSPIDGVHFDAADHQALGRAVAAEVTKLASAG